MPWTAYHSASWFQMEVQITRARQEWMEAGWAPEDCRKLRHSPRRWKLLTGGYANLKTRSYAVTDHRGLLEPVGQAGDGTQVWIQHQHMQESRLRRLDSRPVELV